jgi:hypothetical protein
MKGLIIVEREFVDFEIIRIKFEEMKLLEIFEEMSDLK